MEENKKDKLGEIDKLLRETSSENRLKFETIEADTAVESQESVDDISEDTAPLASESTEAEENTVAEKSTGRSFEEFFRDIVSRSTSDDEQEVDTSEQVRIIDETSTSVEISDSVDFYDDTAEPKRKKAKQKVKLNVGQIILICVFGIALLWCIFFTTDHTLASFGRAPIFSIEVQSYEDGSVSFKGLGYKVQFSFDSNNNLTQKCVPFWEDGPNDVIDQQGGASFE